jgi:hypothetical protein
LFVVVADAMTQASRDRLTRDLLKNYQPIVDPGNIDLEFSVMAICATFDRFTSTATANVWEYQSWKDSRLAWNPSDYSGIQTLRIPAKLLWTPDIRVYTSVSAFVQRDSDVNAVVSADGTVLYIPPTTYRLHCKDNGDTATCNTRVGSWTYDGINVVLKQHGDDGFDLSVYDDSCPALIASHSAKVVTHRYPCCPEPYPSLDLSFTVKQRQEAAGQQHGQRPEL